MTAGYSQPWDLWTEMAYASEIWSSSLEVYLIIQNQNINCKTGVFGGDMKVSLVNDGPITIWLDNKD